MRYVYAIVALGLLVAVHELGHLLAARLLGISVDRFSFGFGPALYSVRWRGLHLTFGAIPLGGFARVRGMNPHEPVLAGDDTAFYAHPAWQRALVCFAGPFTNYVLAVALLGALYMSGTHVPVPMMIGQVQPGGEAARTQLRPGDIVVALDGEPVTRWSQLVDKIADSPGTGVELGLLRQGEPFSVRVYPQVWHGVGRIGVAQQYVYKKHGLLEALPGATGQVHRLMGEALRLTWRMVRGRSVELTSQVTQASDSAASGLESFLRVVVSISVVLALFNLLPLPGLDGGRIAFQVAELVTRRRASAGVETLVHAGGFALLLALIFWVAATDLLRLREPARATLALDAMLPDGGAAGLLSGPSGAPRVPYDGTRGPPVIRTAPMVIGGALPTDARVEPDAGAAPEEQLLPVETLPPELGGPPTDAPPAEPAAAPAPREPEPEPAAPPPARASEPPASAPTAEDGGA